MSLPDLELLVRMDSHPEIGKLEQINKVTPREFVQIAKKIPRKLWQWERRDDESVASGDNSVFSVPTDLQVNDKGKVIPRVTNDRNYWRVEKYYDDDMPWLRLRRITRREVHNG